LLSAAIASENRRSSRPFEQLGEPDQVPESVVPFTVPVKVASHLIPLIANDPVTSQHFWVMVVGTESPYGRSVYFVHAVLRSWFPAMPSSEVSHAPSQTSLSGQAGVVVTATGADAAGAGVDGADAGGAAVDDVQPAVSNAMQRRTRRRHTMPVRFIHF
jgi:hypothetical protein